MNETRLLDEWFLADKLMAKVRISATGCWEWTGCRSHLYGVIRIGGKQLGKILRTHKLSYALFVGPVPDGLCVCHECDNPACCNPAHLWLGTQADNIRDAIRKGRKPPVSKLSATDVQEIRSSDLPGPRLAARYGVTRRQISAIRRGESWKPGAREPRRRTS